MSSWEGELANAAQSPTGIERGPQGLKAVPFREAGNFQSSLRDFSSLESLPRTASWAKFSRPSGTHLVIVGSHADSKALVMSEWTPGLKGETPRHAGAGWGTLLFVIREASPSALTNEPLLV